MGRSLDLWGILVLRVDTGLAASLGLWRDIKHECQHGASHLILFIFNWSIIALQHCITFAV